MRHARLSRRRRSVGRHAPAKSTVGCVGWLAQPRVSWAHPYIKGPPSRVSDSSVHVRAINPPDRLDQLEPSLGLMAGYRRETSCSPLSFAACARRTASVEARSRGARWTWGYGSRTTERHECVPGARRSAPTRVSRVRACHGTLSVRGARAGLLAVAWRSWSAGSAAERRTPLIGGVASGQRLVGCFESRLLLLDLRSNCCVRPSWWLPSPPTATEEVSG